ncbi:MAG: hypothetical protein ABI600_18050 [Luteolibacter sp.]
MPRNRGFALIVTLSLMILLTVIAVGLLTLSSISLRSAGSSSAQATARANARLALMLALGELQKSAGPDTRVTATADALNSATSTKSPLTGVWRSWENTDLDSSKQPKAPAYTWKKALSKDLTNPNDPARFVGWLYSTTPDVTQDPTAPPSLAKTSVSIPLLSTGTLGTAPDAGSEVHLTPVKVTAGTGNKGQYAWWVGGENAKANLGLKKNNPKSDVESRDAMASSGRPDEKILGMDLSAANVSSLISRPSIDLATASPKPPKSANAGFHNITAYSRGLLTNTAGGGWRKDLSLLSEYGLAVSTGAPAAGDPIYPFCTVTRPIGVDKVQCVTWGALMDYFSQYKQTASTSTPGVVSLPPVFGGIGGSNGNDFVDKVQHAPVLADLRMVLAYSAVKDDKYRPLGTDGKVNPTSPTHAAVISILPVVTLWNPWNYQITMKSLRIQTCPLPFNMTLQVGTNTSTFNFNQLIRGLSDPTSKTKIWLDLKSDSSGSNNNITLNPGETKVFSAQQTQQKIIDGPAIATQIQISLTPGYQTEGGFFCVVPAADSTDAKPTYLLGNATDTMQMKTQKVTFPNVIDYLPGRLGGYTQLLGFNSSNTYLSFNQLRVQLTQTDADKFYSDFNNEIYASSPTLATLLNKKDDQIFCSSSLHARTAEGSGFQSRIGFDTNPVAQNYLISPSANEIGSKGPVNAPMELSFYVFGSGSFDSKLPSTTGNILTAIDTDISLTRCVLAEVPLRPVRSLGELQNFQVRGTNPFPPFRAFILGNSAAYPLGKSNDVKVSPSSIFQWDDSYVMNRLFFDDYFVSSIAPETTDWSGSTIKRPLKTVYQEHLPDAMGKRTPLPNAQYLPSARANKEDITADTRHTTIASKLEVDGMFNVNSTSVDAWTSVLSHARDVNMALFKDSGVSLETNAKGHPLPHTTVAGVFSENLNDRKIFAEPKRLSDAQIKSFANEIVKQIRQRGPALSLSEFVNRQLTIDTDPNALAGTIQAALDTLRDSTDPDPSKNPFKDLKIDTQLVTLPPPSQDHGYQFVKAGGKYTGEGLPGWPTQADVLRPIAPILSARDDTFVIRTYGTALAEDGKTVIAKAWCEAIVQRTADFTAPDPKLDLADDANLTTGANKATNILFGRHFNIVSIRYLTANEI